MRSGVQPGEEAGTCSSQYAAAPRVRGDGIRQSADASTTPPRGSSTVLD